MAFERYWIFALLCAVVGLFMLRMVLRERVTLQTSLAFLLILVLTGLFALFPGLTLWVASHMGFTLASNFFFAVSVGALAFLHVASLVHLSRVQLRSVTLTQELALLQDRLDRLERAAGDDRGERATGDDGPGAR